MNPPTAKTVRELRIETLLAATIPHLWEKELSTKTSPKLRALIDLIKRELHKGN
jgi:hypothetical protein